MKPRMGLALLLAALLALSGCSYIVVENRANTQALGSPRYATAAPPEAGAP